MKGWAQDGVKSERFDAGAVLGAARRVRCVHRAPMAMPGGDERLGNEGMKRHG